MLACAGLLLVAMRCFTVASPGALLAEPHSLVPDRRLRFVTCDVQRRHLASEPVVAAIKTLAPDYLILQNIGESDARAVADAMHLRSVFLAARQQAVSSLSDPVGDAVLAKSPLSKPESAGWSGLWTSSGIGSKNVLLVSISASPSGGTDGAHSLTSEWMKRGSPPMVLAAPDLPRGDEFAEGKSGWFDALSPWLRVVPGTPAAELGPRIFLSPGWSCVAGGSISGYALTPAWIDASSSAFATTPTTQQAAQADD
jgi:hypothetical protein